MRLMLKHKIMGLACIAALLPTVVMMLLAGVQRSQISATVRDNLDSLTRDNIKQLALDAYHSCEATNDLIQRQVDYDLKVAEKVIRDAGPARIVPESVSWDTLNQYSGAAGSLTLPKLTIGGRWLGQNKRASIPTPFVDEIQSLVGGACTIFQRMNDQGDMLRVATTIRNSNNDRAIGTYIPAVHPDGTKDPVISAVSRGEPFFGRAYVVNDWYLSAYEPFRDGDGKLIGMIYVGVDQKRVESLRRAINGVKVGKSGEVFVLGGKGQFRGRLIISMEGYRDGDNLWDARDGTGKPYIQLVVQKALALDKDDIGFERYLWKQGTGSDPSAVTAAIAYYQPWDWIIVAAAFDKEFHGARDELESSLDTLFRHSVIAGLAVVALALGIAYLLTRKVTVPIEHITSVAKGIARGDLRFATEAMAIRGKAPGDGALAVNGDKSDETGQLLSAIGSMTLSLNSLVGQVKKSSIQLVSASTQIAAAATQQTATVNGFEESINEVAAATREISATSQELLNTMNDATQTAGNTASLAGSGRQGLSNMEGKMRHLADSTRSISHKLTVISEKTNNINSIVTTITKVADETNLLSLNAAIEAEKAGEAGLGFAVVAREIRRLADQTAVATQDIEQMVKEMRSAVSAGVMEMDKFNEEVRRSVSEVGKISEQLESIIAQVQALTPRFESVNHGMQVQAQGAQQISKSMMGLSEAARQTNESVREFNSATEQLNEAARGLRSEVSHFNLGN